MKRRGFLRIFMAAPVAIPGILAVSAIGSAPNPKPGRPSSKNFILQESFIAGFQYHDGERAWSLLHVGAPLALIREPYNRHDKQAVAVYWRDHKLGYIPRHENTAVAQMMDRQLHLKARILELRESPSPWQRARFSISLMG